MKKAVQSVILSATLNTGCDFNAHFICAIRVVEENNISNFVNTRLLVHKHV